MRRKLLPRINCNKLIKKVICWILIGVLFFIKELFDQVVLRNNFNKNGYQGILHTDLFSELQIQKCTA